MGLGFVPGDHRSHRVLAQSPEWRLRKLAYRFQIILLKINKFVKKCSKPSEHPNKNLKTSKRASYLAVTLFPGHQTPCVWGPTNNKRAAIFIQPKPIVHFLTQWTIHQLFLKLPQVQI